jgi:hypothetical protein
MVVVEPASESFSVKVVVFAPVGTINRAFA